MLKPPDGTRQKSGGGGGSGSGFVHLTASLFADLDVAAVTRHYGDQLRNAGWREEAQGVDGPMAWSTWTVAEDETGRNGLFFIVERSRQPREYFLYVQLDRAADQGNWFTYSGPGE